MRSKPNVSKTSSIPLSLTIGAAAGILVMLAAAALGALAVTREWISEDATAAVSIVITVLSAAVSAITTSHMAGKHKLQISLLSGVLFFAILLTCNALLFDGHYSRVGRTVIIILCTCAAISVLAIRERRTGKSHGRKRPYR